jgi:hypothetical protein
MLEKQLRKIISECVQKILSEKKKNILKVGEKPDPLHHLQGSKKISGGKKSKKIEKKGETAIDKEEQDDDCETCEDDVDDKVKVFHEKNDEDQHEALDDFEFQPQKKSEKKSIKNESRYRLSRILFDDEV